MKVLELFSGTGTLSRIAQERGHDTLTVDLHTPSDLNVDVLDLTPDLIYDAVGWEPGDIDMLWASPICTGFSVAVIGKCWRQPTPGTYIPISDSARLSIQLLERTFEIIQELQPRVWYVENPRGMARKMSVVQGVNRATVTYCQYGENRMKPTDIWHNNPHWHPRPMCKNGDPCHEPAPRGSSTGTARTRSPKRRAKLPDELCVEVIQAAEAVTT